jgi:hypothetical protein
MIKSVEEYSMKKKLELINSMLDDPNNDIESIFKNCYKLHDYSKHGNRPIGTIECGSTCFADTSKTLYRLLFLSKPETIDFSDMYKSYTLIELCSPCYEFCVSFQFYKYELAAHFHCAEQHITGKLHPIICGVPGSNNGVKCKSKLGNLWFSTLKNILEHKRLIYSGNNFSV